MKTNISNDMKRYNHLLKELDTVYHEMSLKLGLSDSAMIILYTICENGDSCLLQEICHQSGISKQTINSAIRKLEAEGIVRLEAADAKKKKVYLTQRGIELAESTAFKIIEAENDVFASWQKDDVEKYLALTEKFLSDLKERGKDI